MHVELCILYLCSMSCIDCQFASRSNSRCWFWSLKTFMAWHHTVWGTSSPHLDQLTIHLTEKAYCRFHQLGIYIWWRLAFFAVVPTLWNTHLYKIRLVPSLLILQKAIKFNYMTRPGAPIEPETCLDYSIVKWAFFIFPSSMVGIFGFIILIFSVSFIVEYCPKIAFGEIDGYKTWLINKINR